MSNKKFLILTLSLFAISCSGNLSKTSSKEEIKPVVEKKSEEKKQDKAEEAVVFFDTNSSKLSNEAITLLQKDVLPNLKKSTSVKLRIEGYCDERGSVAYNKKLGKKRAESVKSYLVKNGAKSSKIKLVTYGESNPTDIGHDETAWAKNRRAVTIFIEK